MVPLLHGAMGDEGVTVATDPFLANCTLTVLADGHTALPVGTSEYASEKEVVEPWARVNKVAA